MLTSPFRTATEELVKSGERFFVEGCDDSVCKPLLSVGEYTTMGGVTVLYGDKGYLFHRGRRVDPEVDERFTILRLYSCVQREQRVQHVHETERKQD